MKKSVFAPGKIILSGEYAVMFGYPGIAIPSTLGITATFEENDSNKLTIVIEKEMKHPKLEEFIQDILKELKKNQKLPNGTLTIDATLPVGKGMGSSTALVICICKVFGVEEKESVRTIEDSLTPGNSGIDFEVIWTEKPILLEEKTQSVAELDLTFLKNALLIDTGLPKEPTSELVSWVRERKSKLEEPLHEIMHCTQDLLSGKNIFEIFRRHHKAQIKLGVVPEAVQQLIAGIEHMGGNAKVIGAGGRTGGGGMVLVIHANKDSLRKLASLDYSVLDV